MPGDGLSRQLASCTFHDGSPDGLLRGLARFLELALGPRQASFGYPVPDPVPRILREFYLLCGRRPAPYPDRSPIVFENDQEGYFYVGVQHAHLSTPEGLRAASSHGYIVASEHSGNWTAYVGDGYDPEVWVSGWVRGGDASAPIPSGDPLSRWLIAMCLSSIAWEPHNNLASGTSTGESSALVRQWLRGRTAIFSAVQTICPEVAGRFSVHGGYLIHETDAATRVAALDPQAAALLRDQRKLFDCFD